jgi:hypothetical protein
MQHPVFREVGEEKRREFEEGLARMDDAIEAALSAKAWALDARAVVASLEASHMAMNRVCMAAWKLHLSQSADEESEMCPEVQAVIDAIVDLSFNGWYPEDDVLQSPLMVAADVRRVAAAILRVKPPEILAAFS